MRALTARSNFCRRAIASAIAAVMTASGLVLASPDALAVGDCFSYSDFSSTAGLTLAGSASIQSGNVLQLTPAQNSQAGAAYRTSRIDVDSGFSATFVYKIVGDAADGFAFVIHGSSPALGAGGGGLGYDGVTNSVAVEFDTFQNAELSDPNGNHIAVHTRGTLANSSNESATSLIQTIPAPPNLTDGQSHTIEILYGVPGGLQVKFDGTSVTPPNTFNLATVLSLQNGAAFLGFSAGTGGLNQAHQILSWSVCSEEPTEWQLTAQRTGKGRIKGTDGLINCRPDCTELYPSGRLVTLRAKPKPGYVLKKWTGACRGKAKRCTVTMNADKTATAKFVLAP